MSDCHTNTPEFCEDSEMSSTQGFQLATASLTDALYESVRKRIISEEIKPGEKITEARLTAEYGVARPTAKACLERLVVVGLVRRTAHKSAVVPLLDKDDVLDLFFARESVEASAVRLLADSDGVPKASVQAHRDLEAANASQSFSDGVQADIAFHRSLVHGTGSERLARMHDLIIGEVELTMGFSSAHQQTSRTAIATEHAAILDAIARHDAAGAEDALRQHLVAAQARILSSLPEPDPS